MDENQNLVYMCFQCHQYQTVIFRRLIQHLRLVHEHEPNFSVRCGIHGCEKVYTKVDSYIKHIQRNHRGFQIDAPSNAIEENCLQDYHCEPSVANAEKEQILYDPGIEIGLTEITKNN